MRELLDIGRLEQRVARMRQREVLGNLHGVLIAQALALERLAHLVGNRLHEGDPADTLVVGGDEMPHAVGRIRALEQRVDDRVVLVIVLVLPYVGIRHAPRRALVFAQLVDPLLLGLLAHVEEAFDDEVAVVDELPLEQMRGLGVQADRAARSRHGKIARVAQERMGSLALLALVREGVVVHEDLHGLAVPAPVEDGDGTVLADALPVARHERVAALLLRGSGHGVDPKRARVEVFDELGDGRALA